MAETVQEHQQGNVPPAGEEVHMPPPSILPLVNASGLAIAIVSVTLSVYLVIFGAIVFLWTAAVWIRDTRRDIAQLPLDHSHH